MIRRKDVVLWSMLETTLPYSAMYHINQGDPEFDNHYGFFRTHLFRFEKRVINVSLEEMKPGYSDRVEKSLQVLLDALLKDVKSFGFSDELNRRVDQQNRSEERAIYRMANERDDIPLSVLRVKFAISPDTPCYGRA